MIPPDTIFPNPSGIETIQAVLEAVCSRLPESAQPRRDELIAKLSNMGFRLEFVGNQLHVAGLSLTKPATVASPTSSEVDVEGTQPSVLRDHILSRLKVRGRCKPSEIADLVLANGYRTSSRYFRTNVCNMLQSLKRDGLVRSPQRGWWELVS